METEKINQALAQLEISLKELDSARAQVEKVTDSGNSLANATSSLVKEVKQLADKIATETSKIITGFSDKITVLEASINNTTKEGQKKISSEVDKFIKTTSELKSNNESTISDFKNLSIKTIKDQETEVSKTIQSILSYCENVQKLIDAISTMDLPARMDKIESSFTITSTVIKKLSEIQTGLCTNIETLSAEIKANAKKQNTNAIITWVLIAVTLCATVVIGLMK